ncbi:hypothetical protein [Paraburkholderia rhizosphaerae]|uniref:Lipoprotein n=1 Tax=Paraburkholderia rhizosphaerae TaxID=480658 RepID=A0A4R8LV40_9BURK|nr:hypothetical protein [Paraburkholderia rhizosphaerae]TDY51659.1 hypothetical protein BX592_107227 [Paraburkholderia rhizosphaerae]
MNTFQILLRIALSFGACTTLGACMTSTPAWDRNFGYAVTQIRQMQTLNPDASDNTNPVAGVDGRAADAAQTAYVKSFTAPTPPTNVFTIGVGAGN